MKDEDKKEYEYSGNDDDNNKGFSLSAPFKYITRTINGLKRRIENKITRQEEKQYPVMALPPGQDYILPPTLVVDFGAIGTGKGSAEKGTLLKRPFFDLFIDTLSEYCEIVLIDDCYPADMASSIMDTLDPRQRVTYKFYNKFVKSVSHLNRDLDRVIIVTGDPNAFQDTPKNVIVVPTFSRGMRDNDLYVLTEILMDILNPPDEEENELGEQDIDLDYTFNLPVTSIIPKLQHPQLFEMYFTLLKYPPNKRTKVRNNIRRALQDPELTFHIVRDFKIVLPGFY